jgi:adenylate cyclase
VETKAKISGFLKDRLEYCVALIAFLFFFALSLTETGVKTELGMYDTLLAIKPEIRERGDVLLVNIDDEAIEQIGAFPWTRDVIADALIRLREAGGKTVVFDIEYMTPGQSGVNREYVKNVFPAEYSGVKSEMLQYIKDFSDAVAARNIPLSSVGEVGGEMSGYIDQRMGELSGSITSNIFRDNDEYFAKALRFFGHAYVTINAEKINTGTGTDELNKFARDHKLVTNVVDRAGIIRKENDRTFKDSDYDRGIAPAILPLLRESAGAGFPNVVIDPDGIRRRIQLLVEYDGAYVPQLVFAPILDILKPERIVRSGRSLTLVNALDPANLDSGKRKNIVIPLDEHGYFLINWLKREFIDTKNPSKMSFRQMSINALKVADDIEVKLIDNLNSILALGIKTANGYLSYNDAVTALLAKYRDLGAWKQALLDGKRDDYDAYFAARKDFFAEYGKFLSGGYDTEIYETFERVAASSGDKRYLEYEASVKKNFDIYRSDYKLYQDHCGTLAKKCAGAFCLIGWSGLGTSDLGINPFAKAYANVGTHANIYNTIMTEEFINPLPRWASWALALALCWGSALAYRRIKSLKGRLSYGVGSTVAVFVGIALVFVAVRVYVQLFVPLLSVFATFLLITILRFVFSEQEKSFLRKAFTMYLSSDVVNQIVADPSLLKLGGQEKRITALFTDIKSFSTLSEKVTPEHLVEILNKYLTVMSDIVLEQKGTIDKYIGDAIVSFFGAPLDLPDHATRACLAAVRMKEAEKRLNEEMLATNASPSPIYTRIGINTGAMVVGNMGTDNKMNYTIMGNDVNLAARLEGVNKQYGTWILVSESTWNETGGMFLGRKLDRVRVVGIETPVQLYNIIAVRSEASGNQVALVDRFNLAIDAYRERRFADALLLFTKCAELAPEDDASRIYLDRVRALLRDGVPEGWSDIITMTAK